MRRSPSDLHCTNRNLCCITTRIKWHFSYTAFNKILTDVFIRSIWACHLVCCCVRRHRNFIPDCQARKRSHVFFDYIRRLFWLMALFCLLFCFFCYILSAQYKVQHCLAADSPHMCKMSRVHGRIKAIQEALVE